MDKIMTPEAGTAIVIYRAKDIQQILGIGREKAYALMRSSSFPSTRIGKTYFVTAANFNMWLNEYKHKSFVLKG